PPLGNAANVATNLHAAQLHAKHLDGTGVAVAVVDTGINLQHLQTKLGHMPKFDAAASWTPPGTPPPAPGAWPVNHATMCAYDALIAAPVATLVDFPVLSAHFPGSGSIMSGTLAAALVAYGFMLNSRASGRLKTFKALVASNSWGIFHPSWDFPAGHPAPSPPAFPAATATTRRIRSMCRWPLQRAPASTSSSRPAIAARPARMAAARDEPPGRSWAPAQCARC